ncbi:four helix bundle protein [Joostella sp. CR20]|uniref:four helix bundle protein n=1 Tax=Joostella sp. CR20 TaxID=2804312 RepID=UPI00313CB778
MKEVLKNRTKTFAIDVWKMCDELPNSTGIVILKRQLIRCSTSVGANYRAACRAKSKADFVHKLKIVEEEADEAMYFLELLDEVCVDVDKRWIKKLHTEANEILSIIVASIKTVRSSNS